MDNEKSSIINFRVTSDQKKQFVKKSQLYHCSISKYIINMCLCYDHKLIDFLNTALIDYVDVAPDDIVAVKKFVKYISENSDDF